MSAEPTVWTFGTWTLTAERDGDIVRVFAVRYTKTDGSRHGSYALLPSGEVVTVSMADTKVNEHMQTAKVRRLLDEVTR